ncbi:MAG: UvrD-helicase domain-containing protein [Nitriliruptorales bacterium]
MRGRVCVSAGGLPTPPDRELVDRAARERIAADLASTLFVEAGAGAGKTKSLVDRVVALVASGIQMPAIAAITFTEKAAAELRDRIRRAFESRAADPDLDPTGRARFRTALEEVDVAAISTLHAFAQRILREHPIEAGLPPNVEVLDEVASEIEFEDRWRRFRDALLATSELERGLLLAFAAEVRLSDLRHIARVFDDNWDLVAEEQRFPWPAEDPPPCEVDRFVTRIEGLLARRSECRDGDDKLCQHLTHEIAPYLERLRTAPDEYEALRLLAEEKPSFSYSYGRKENWRDKGDVRDEMVAIGEDKACHAEQIALAALRRITLELARFTLEAAEQRRSHGRLEFHDLLVLARQLLRGPNGPPVRQALRERYQRLLLDEFQDTDPIQIDLAVLIASDDPAAADKPWWEIDAEPGRLFFVGDPKQSIYRFRRADIDLFLQARDVFGQPPVLLTTNFRTTPAVIAWVNHVFGRLIVPEDGSQPRYQPLAPAPTRTSPPTGPPVAVLGSQAHHSELDADALREREADQVADAVLTATTWKVARPRPDGTETWDDARLGDIAILLPARTSLPALERALETRDIPYRAEASSLVYSTREVRDLHSAVRALADPGDQLSLVTALRSPLFGCGDDDLFTYKVIAGGAWHILVDPPPGLERTHPVVAAMGYLRDLHRGLPWLTPSELLDRIARDRRLFELGYVQGGAGGSPALHGRPRDLWRRLRFVIDQARAWSEAEGGTLREYLEWARMQASESARVAETVLPETDDDSVRILTVHASKGLEFPITILSGMTTASRGRTNRVEVAFPPGEAVALKVGRKLTTPEFEKFKPIDEQMDFHERIRLLYVACTRAKDHLVVSLHRRTRKRDQPEQAKWTNAELMYSAGVEAPHQADLFAASGPASDGSPPPGSSQLRPPLLLPLAEWEEERAAKLSSSSVRRTLGASDIAGLAAEDGTVDGEVDGDVAAGTEKQPRDLELPPWQKGRYGTAVGRAVHAVLQTIDLASGEGLEQAAAAQAAAEGVIGRESEILTLARAALESEAVKEALHHPRWRETYVAARFGERTLEGYIDLLYRATDGLVVVDYKTAANDANLDARVEHYRTQGGAYALAVEEATGEPVVRVVFVFLTAAGPVERVLVDLDRAKKAVRTALDNPTKKRAVT